MTMEYRRLGRTDIRVSALCLGTMTWGHQNSEAEAHAQLDFALDQGINFIDTAEMYAVPPSAERYGKTEQYIGTWLKDRPDRDKIVLATKVAGPNDRPFVRDGKNRLDARNITAALEASLKRLRTDYVDLYQLHWPDRSVNSFGKLGFVWNPDEKMTPPEETLDVLDGLVKEGKIRHVGLSNETPWGVMRFLRLAETRGLPRMQSIQNPYNLLNRSFEVGLAECAIREEIGLLAYAPLAAGVLTGKYLGGAKPPGSRWTVFDQKSRYAGPRSDAAVARYVRIAKDHGLDPAQMAIAYVLSRPFVTAAILGATGIDQLRTDIASQDVALSDDVLRDLDAVQADNPNPCP